VYVCVCVCVCVPSIIAYHVFYCDVSGRLVLFAFNKLID